MPGFKKAYFPNLDGLRSVAFLAVFFGHCFVLFPFFERTAVIKFLFHLISNADLGVNAFFVLSGFLISYLLLQEKQTNGTINIKLFYLRRVLRIWPVYFSVVIAGIILSMLPYSDYSLKQISFPMLLTFLTNIDLAYHDISSLPLAVLWSVAVEEQFYLVLPLLIVAFGKKVFYSFPLFILLSFYFRYTHRHDFLILHYHTFSVFSALLVGCLIAFFSIEKKLVSYIKKIPRWVIAVVYISLLALIFYRNEIFRSEIGIPLDNLVFSCFFAFIILEQNYCERSFYKMSQIKVLSRMGKYTYSLYAFHIITITLLANVFIQYFNPVITNYMVYFGLYLLALIISLGISILSYRFVEKPFLMLKEKFNIK
jgi:peptidoglycan/LPS O-acetylase OafA/YrhL